MVAYAHNRSATVIDLTTESILSLSQAAALLPPGRGGVRPTLSCIVRWILKGAKSPSGERVRLEGIRLGGRWITSREALQRFAERLTPQLDNNVIPPPRSLSKRQRTSERAARELDRMGI
jgi:hypothetical protein